MKKLILFGFTLILATGCSSKPAAPAELSPQEKQINFDVCVIETTVTVTKELKERYAISSLDSNQVRIMEEQVENYCVKFLK
jgi:uncharacterized protein YcfL